MREKYILLAALVISFGDIAKRNECNGRRVKLKPKRPKVSIEKHWHVASIRLRPLDNPFGNGHICSGTLFAVNKILSSADCLIQDRKMYRFFNPSKLRIVLGIIDRYHKLEDTVVISSGVKYAYHPNYTIETGANDVSVIFFQQGILKNHPFIKPLPLFNSPLDDESMATSSELKDTEMIILTRELCRQTKLEGLICARNKSSHSNDGCLSELGECLVCNLSLAGVVAYDISCQWYHEDAHHKLNTVFTAVSYHSAWITSTEPIIYSREVSLSNNQFLYLFGIILGEFLNYYV